MRVDGPAIDPQFRPIPAWIERAQVVDIDPVRYRVRVRTEYTGRLVWIPWLSAYGHHIRGEGSGVIPEVGALCLVLRPTDFSEPQIIGFSGMPSSDDGYRAGRPIGNPGDWYTRSRDGNYIAVLRGGIIDVAATPICRTIYFPASNLVRRLFENETLEWPGGLEEHGVRSGVVASGSTPTYASYAYREFAQGEEVVRLGFGRVPSEDDRAIGAGLFGEAPPGAIVFTFDISNTLGIRADRDGNTESVQKGGAHVVVQKDMDLTIGGNFDVTVGGQLRIHWQDRADVVNGDSSIEVTGNQLTLVEQSETINVRGTSRRLARSVDDVVGSLKLAVDGPSEVQVMGSDTRVVGGGSSRTVGGPSSDLVLGTREVVVAHAEDPTALAQDALADMVRLLDGARKVITQAGSQEWVVGPEDSPLCTMKMHGDPTRPARLGRFTIDFHAAGAQVLFDGLTGTLEMRNGAGLMRLGSDGRVELGNRGGALGHIVTTASHPVDYFTGAPILGCAAAIASGAPVPGPAVPSPPVLDR